MSTCSCRWPLVPGAGAVGAAQVCWGGGEGTGQLAPPGSVGLAEEPVFRVLRNPFCLVVLTTPRI